MSGPACLTVPGEDRLVLQVKQIQDFKRSLPKETKLVVCKNTLMKRAADAVEGWSELKDSAKVLFGGRWLAFSWWQRQV